MLTELAYPYKLQAMTLADSAKREVLNESDIAQYLTSRESQASFRS